MFIAALFTIANIWKQPECPSVDEWIGKAVVRGKRAHGHGLQCGDCWGEGA